MIQNINKMYLSFVVNWELKNPWKELGFDFPDKEVQFQVIYENEWKNKINKIFV